MKHAATFVLSVLLMSSTTVRADTLSTPVLETRAGASSALNDYNFNISADGRTLVFARSKANFGEARIMIADRDRDGNWAAAMPISFSDERYKDSDPWLTPDGNTLYFVSNRPTSARPDKKDTDIWRARRKDGVWQAPEHLGDAVNGPSVELGPEVHGDRIYFNSNRGGNLDIYAAPIGIDGSVGTAELLPAPINSPAQEGDFTLTSDGQVALFWSLRDGNGKLYALRRVGDGWGPAVVLPDTINKGDFQFTPQIMMDRTGPSLAFASTAERSGQDKGMADIYTVPLATVLQALPQR